MLLIPAAFAFDEPVWFLKEGFGGGVFPEGVQSETIAQYRTPLHRSDSIVFQGTYAGAGARVALTPVFADAGPMLSIAPIDVFDMDFGASWVQYFSWGGNGLLPFDEVGGKLGTERSARESEQFSAGALQLWAAPTLKIKLGPIIAFDAWNVAWLRMEPVVGAPYYYEPGRDLIVEFTDVVSEQQVGLLYEVLPGGDRALFLLGATWRDRHAYGSGDHSMVVGGFGVLKPGTKPVIPTIVLLVMPYLVDTDHVGGPPNIQTQLSWTVEKPVGR